MFGNSKITKRNGVILTIDEELLVRGVGVASKFHEQPLLEMVSCHFRDICPSHQTVCCHPAAIACMSGDKNIVDIPIIQNFLQMLRSCMLDNGCGITYFFLVMPRYREVLSVFFK